MKESVVGSKAATCVVCLVIGLCIGSIVHALYSYKPSPPPSVGDRITIEGVGGSSGQPACVWVFDVPNGLDVLVLKEPAVQPVMQSQVDATFGRAETLSDGRVIRVFTHCVPRK